MVRPTAGPYMAKRCGSGQGSQELSRILVFPRLAKVPGHRLLFAILRPAQRGAVVNGVPDVQPGPALDQQSHDQLVAPERGLMQRRGMAVVALRVVPIRVFAGVEQQANDLDVSVQGSQRE